jgi:hypothetical protein
MQLEISIRVVDDGDTVAKPVEDSLQLPTLWVGPTALDGVLFDFNPTGDIRVATIKALCAGVIQMMRQHSSLSDASPPIKRMTAIACTQIEIAQMCAVKAYWAK